MFTTIARRLAVAATAVALTAATPAAALADTAAPPAKAASGLGLRKSGGNSTSGVMQRAGPQLRVVRRRTPPYSWRAPASPSSRSSRAPPAAPFRPTIIGPSRGESPLGAVASLWRVPAKTAFGRRTRETGWRGRKPLAKSKNGSPQDATVSYGPAGLLSGRQDLNLRPPGPQPGALPDCATPRGQPMISVCGRGRTSRG